MSGFYVLQGCGSKEAVDPTVAPTEGFATQFERCAAYPEYDRVIGYDSIVPPIGWRQAYAGDGTQRDFSFEDVFCGREYAETKTIILVVGAGWCQACTRLAQQYIDPIAQELTQTLGAVVIYLEIQNSQSMPADNTFAFRHMKRIIDDGPGWRVGDADTRIRDGDAMAPAPGFIASQMNLPVLPAVWVIRKRDMRVIATRELAWQSRPGELPLKAIAMDPEQDWRDPPQPEFRSQCAPGDEEETEGFTNNESTDATSIGLGLHMGGICDLEPDFYAVEVDGAWRLNLSHDLRQGDLDLVLWDMEYDRAALDENGRIIGSFTSEAVETIEGDGMAIVQVRGYLGDSAAYTISLEGR